MTKTILMTYNGHSIQFRDDGWFNATLAAEKYGKRPVDWLALESTQEYINALCDILRSEKSSLLKVKRGGRGKQDATWMHPKLGVAFARWLDVRFAVWCDTQIEMLLHGNPQQQDWRRLRHEAASSYKVMSDVLTESRADVGKDTQSYHYANEAKLVNWALTGEYAALDRESLSTAELDLLAKLESRNAVLLAKGASRDLRKELLTAITERHQLQQLPA